MKKHLYIVIVTALLVAVQAWFSYLTFKHPYIGIGLTINSHNEYVVNTIVEQSGAAARQIQVGDVVKLIDGKLPSQHVTVLQWNIVEKARTLVLLRGDEEFTERFDNKSFQADYLSYLGYLVCIFVGCLVYVKLRVSRSARLLVYVIVSLGGIYLSLGASIRGDALGKIFISVLVSGIPYFFMHFLIVFFEEKLQVRFSRLLIKVVYSFLTLYFLIHFLSLLPSMSQIINQKTTIVTLLFFLIGCLLVFCYLGVLQKRYSAGKPFIKTILSAIGISFFVSIAPISILSFLPMIITGDYWVMPLYTSYFVLSFPLSFTYLIATRQLYDIDIVLRRLAYSAAIAVIPSAIVVGTESLIFKNEMTIGQIAIKLLLVLVVFTVVLYSLEYWTTRLEKVMFPRKYHLRHAMKKIAGNLGSIPHFRRMRDIVLVDIVDILQVHGGAIVFVASHDIDVIVEGDIDRHAVKALVERGENERQYTKFEINKNEEYTSYLVITPKKTQTMLGKEELQWINLIMSYLSVSMENLYLIRKLSRRLQEMTAQLQGGDESDDIVWLRKSMFDLQERERSRIAADLHDTAMQDLHMIGRKLREALKLLEDGAAYRQIAGVINHLELVHVHLRQSCFELNPRLLEHAGLIAAVQYLVDIEARESEFEVRLECENEQRIERCGLEVKRHLFRIIQELLNNARKHSNASRILLRIWVDKAVIHLVYTDDGDGFDASHAGQVVPYGLSGIGLEQMRGRVLQLQGNIDIRSRASGGVRVTIGVPIVRQHPA